MVYPSNHASQSLTENELVSHDSFEMKCSTPADIVPSLGSHDSKDEWKKTDRSQNGPLVQYQMSEDDQNDEVEVRQEAIDKDKSKTGKKRGSKILTLMSKFQTPAVGAFHSFKIKSSPGRRHTERGESDKDPLAWFQEEIRGKKAMKKSSSKKVN